MVHLLVRAIEGLLRAKRCGSSKMDVRSVRMRFLDAYKQGIGATRALGNRLLVSYRPLARKDYLSGATEEESLRCCSRPREIQKYLLLRPLKRCRAFGSFTSARTQLKPTDRRLAQICTAIAVDARKATKNVRTTTPTPPRLQRGNRPTRRPRRPRPRRRPAKQPKERRLGRRRPVAGWVFRWW